MKHKLRIQPSAIHGKGLFAIDYIRKDTVLGKVHGSFTHRQGVHVLSGDKRRLLVTCKFRYINHSKQPNVAYLENDTVLAIQDIERGEELTHDYGEEWD